MVDFFVLYRSLVSRVPTSTQAAHGGWDSKLKRWAQFSTNSNQLSIPLQKDDQPVHLSSSPLKDYKTTKTFGDENAGQPANVSNRPIIIGTILLSVLAYVMFFVEGESLDLFSTETLNELQEKINSKLDLQNANEESIDTKS